MEIERRGILRSPCAGNGLLRLVAHGEGHGDRLAVLVEHQLALGVGLQHRVGVALREARGERGVLAGEVILRDRTVLLFDGGNGLAVLVHDGLVVGVQRELGRIVRPSVLNLGALVVQHVGGSHLVLDRGAIG